MQLYGIIVHEEKPIAAPGNIAGDSAVTRHLDRHIGSGALAGDVDDRNFAGFMKSRGNRAHWRFDAVSAVADLPQIRESGYQTDRTVHTHAEISNIVEENYSSGTGGIGRLAEDSTDDDFGTARFVGECAAEVIVIEAKALHLMGHRTAAEFGAAANDNSGGFAAGVGVHDVDTFDGAEHVRGAIFDTWLGKTHE